MNADILFVIRNIQKYLLQTNRIDVKWNIRRVLFVHEEKYEKVG